jgi:hypothetical protein
VTSSHDPCGGMTPAYRERRFADLLIRVALRLRAQDVAGREKPKAVAV